MEIMFFLSGNHQEMTSHRGHRQNEDDQDDVNVITTDMWELDITGTTSCFYMHFRAPMDLGFYQTEVRK